MKLKYYLRGIGIGMLVTALILTISYRKKTTITDEEIITRAKALGMIESSTLAEAAKPETHVEPNEEVKEEAAPGAKEETTEEAASGAKEETTSTDEKKAEEGNGETSVPESEKTSTEKPASIPEKKADDPLGILPTAAPANSDEKTAQIKQQMEGNTTTPNTSTTSTSTANTSTANISTVSVAVHSGDSSVTVAKSVETAGLVESATDFDAFLCKNGYDKRLRVGTFDIPYDLTYGEIAEILVGN